MEHIETIHDIDWVSLREKAYAQKSRRKKSAQEWDRRAEQFAKRVSSRSHKDGYIAQVLQYIEPYIVKENCRSVLDIGSGPGTLTLPIAEIVTKVSKEGNEAAGQVTALDFSHRMLEILHKKALEQGIDNITTAPVAWEDDWQAAGIIPHDITLASRSIGVEDIEGALKKINNFAQKAVFLTDRIGAAPFEPEAFAAAGVELRPAPDYIYTLNILYQLGIYANVAAIEFDRVQTYRTMAEAMESFLWMLGKIDEAQERGLHDYILSISNKNADGTLTVCRKSPPRWALIYWDKENGI